MSSRSTSSQGEPELNAAFAPRLEHAPRGVEWFTMQEAARVKGVSYATVSRAVRTEKLAARRSGRMVLISEFDLTAWEPIRARAPRSYRHREPDPECAHGVIELAHGEGLELTRRISSHYETLLRSALDDQFEEFTAIVVERFALAMEFSRVVLWLVNPERSHIELVARTGTWFAPDDEPSELVRIEYDPNVIYIASTAVYEGINCWLAPPLPVRFRQAFSATLVANDQVLGYLLGDHDGDVFTMTEHQISLGHLIASVTGVAIELHRRGHGADREIDLPAEWRKIPMSVQGGGR